MATSVEHFEGRHPGVSHLGAHAFHISDHDKKYRRHAANHIAAMAGKKTLMAIGGLSPYVEAQYTATKENSSTIAEAGDGLRFQTDATATDEDDITITSARTYTIAANKIFTMTAKVKVSHATSFGFLVGFVTSGSTVPGSTAPADGVYFIKAHSSAALTARVIENSQAADDVTDFMDADGTASAVTIVADTFVELGMKFMAGSSADNSWGEWLVDGFVTKMTAAQVTAVYTMLATTPAVLAAHVGFRVDGTTQRNGILAFALADVDA